MFSLVSETDPILRQKLEPFDFDNPPVDPKDLFEQMKEAMMKNNGLGLSACQVGLPYRMFVLGDPSNEDSIFPVFNPLIVDTSEDVILLEEGCLSFPMLYLKIKRYESVRVRFADVNGEIETQKLSGLTARVFQHEFDHMEGVLFIERANLYHLENGRNKRKKNLKLKKKHVRLNNQKF